MRIAIFTETFIHKNTAAANQAAVLQKGLQQLGHKVLIVTGSTKATEIILDKGMLCCPASKSNNFYRQSANKIYAHMLDYYIGAFKPDVLHILTMSEIGMAGLRFGQKNHVPIISTVHEFHNAQQLDGEQSLQQIFSLIMQPLAQRHAQKILSHSQIVTYSSRQLVSHIKEYAPKAKIIRIPYCVNDVKFRMYGISEQACWEMKERLRLKPDDTGVIFAGQLYKNNNVDQLLYYWKKCVKSTDTLRLIIAGDGPQMNYLKNLALEYGIMSQVTFTGELSQEELNTCFAVCDVFVSATGSMTMKASAGSNCVRRAGHYPKESANADIVIEGQNGFTYENPIDMYRLMRNFTNMSSRQRAYLRTLVSKTAERLTPASQAETILKLYLSLKRNSNIVQK
ncbi:MAG: glycosyltransferase [Acutalibacteraceae bacterium]